jgi:hypothetical protein
MVNPSALSMRRSSETRRKPMSVAGTCWRRFMLGSSSVPPATSIVSAGERARRSAASATVAGA